MQWIALLRLLIVSLAYFILYNPDLFITKLHSYKEITSKSSVNQSITFTTHQSWVTWRQFVVDQINKSPWNASNISWHYKSVELYLGYSILCVRQEISCGHMIQRLWPRSPTVLKLVRCNGINESLVKIEFIYSVWHGPGKLRYTVIYLYILYHIIMLLDDSYFKLLCSQSNHSYKSFKNHFHSLLHWD